MTELSFNKMRIFGNDFSVNRKVPFKQMGTFKLSTTTSVIQFAYDMTFGAKGEHRHTRSGGSVYRNNFEIFANTFQGKLSEFAVANLFFKHKDFKAPDLTTHSRGIWEDVDFLIGEYAIAVKSTKHYGNLLLLEKQDWNSQGHYLTASGSPRIYTHIMLVRIKPDIEEIIRSLNPNSLNQELFNPLKSKILEIEWSYDIPGFIESKDLYQVINANNIITKGARLNLAVTIDADNYYVQAGDLRKIATLKI
jgi:hypothetical protein